jgi:hypothetical protein
MTESDDPAPTPNERNNLYWIVVFSSVALILIVLALWHFVY